MTEETRKLFDAPWEVCLEKRGSFYRPCVVSSDTKIASVCTKGNANRLARLPELYDALVEAVYDACQDCLVERSYVSEDEDEDYDLIENGCVYPERDCCPKCRSWIEILRKVRDGK